MTKIFNTQAEVSSALDGDFRLTAPDKIRADKFTFSIIVLKQIDRVLALMPMCVKEDTQESMLALKAGCDGLDFLIKVKAFEEYNDFSTQMQVRLQAKQYELALGRDARIEYYLILKQYLDGMVKQFSRLGLMHAESTTATMGFGETEIEGNV